MICENCPRKFVVKSIGKIRIFKIWPVNKVIQKIIIGQKLHVPVYCRHIEFTLLLLRQRIERISL